jgi:peroxiredoxin
MHARWWWFRVVGLAVGVLTAPNLLWAEAVVGQPAPPFSETDTTGGVWTLAGLRGKLVVLEWFNPDCPFVRKHYDSGNMQQLQRTATGQGVVWLSVNSSAPGKQGHLTPEQAEAFIAQRQAAPTAVLLDPAGQLGRRYGAKTTPHLFVINPEGVLVYAGAVDSVPSPDPADIPGAVNYVRQALDETLAGRSLTISQTKPYGCSVKYAD